MRAAPLKTCPAPCDAPGARLRAQKNGRRPDIRVISFIRPPTPGPSPA